MYVSTLRKENRIADNGMMLAPNSTYNYPKQITSQPMSYNMESNFPLIFPALTKKAIIE